MIRTRMIVLLVLFSIVGAGMVSAQVVSVTGSLSTVVGASLEDVTTASSVDVAPSYEAKVGTDAMVTSLGENLVVQASEVESQTQVTQNARVATATGVDDDVLVAVVPLGIRASVLSRIAEIRSDAVDRFDARTTARIRMANLLRERAQIVARTGIDRDLSRIAYARIRAQEYGNSDVADRLEAIRLRLQAQADAGDTETSDEDRRELDRVIWFQFANRLSLESERLIGVADNVNNSMTRILNQMDTLQARLDGTRDPSAFGRLDQIQSNAEDAKAELEAELGEARSALTAFKTSSTVENARTLHQAMVELKVAAQEGNRTVRLWVVYYNHLQRNDGRDDRDLWSRIAPRILTRDQIDARATVEANDALRVSMYGNVSATGGV